MDRMTGELKNYDPHVVGIESEVCKFGPQVVSSALQTYLRAKGVADAYDRLKDIVMKPIVNAGEVSYFIDGVVSSGRLSAREGTHVKGLLSSVMNTRDLMARLENASGEKEVNFALAQLRRANSAYGPRRVVLGTTVEDTYRMIQRGKRTAASLARYA